MLSLSNLCSLRMTAKKINSINFQSFINSFFSFLVFVFVFFFFFFFSSVFVLVFKILLATSGFFTGENTSYIFAAYGNLYIYFFFFTPVSYLQNSN